MKDAKFLEAMMNRRLFLTSAAAAGAGLVLSPAARAQAAAAAAAAPADTINVAIIGAGNQGRNLLRNAVKVEGVKFRAVCDIWTYSQDYAGNGLKKAGHEVNIYEDYREMLDKEKELDAVIVASPDCWHADHTVACLEAGKHVYCEKEMAHSLDEAKRMVEAARKSGKLLQIGHQRRSEPRYWHALKLIDNDKILGKITHFYGQWNRATSQNEQLPAPSGKYAMSDEKLKQYGYESGEQFRNWRWYKKYSGGPIVDLGSHQIDVFNWFLKSQPTAIMASGGTDYYKDREWYDNVVAVYEYVVDGRTLRGTYQVFNTTSHGGFYETFMGDEGSMVVSEDTRLGHFFREKTAAQREWEQQSDKVKKDGEEAFELKIGETLSPDGQKDPKAQELLAESQKEGWQLHLENFFDAMRGKAKLTCPPEIAYETAVTVLKVNEAIAAGTRLEFKPEDFKV